jgi:endonuclease YncB( thermonuclease family)
MVRSVMTFTLAAALSLVCTAPVVVDGDTLRCRNLGPVRLMAIDAPEMPGHCRRGRTCVEGDGAASSAALRRIIGDQRVICEPAGRDAYRRVLARCVAGGVDLSCAMVARGFAVERYGRLDCRKPLDH